MLGNICVFVLYSRISKPLIFPNVSKRKIFLTDQEWFWRQSLFSRSKILWWIFWNLSLEINIDIIITLLGLLRVGLWTFNRDCNTKNFANSIVDCKVLLKITRRKLNFCEIICNDYVLHHVHFLAVYDGWIRYCSSHKM